MITTNTNAIFETFEEKCKDALANQRNIIWRDSQYAMNDFIGSLLNELIKNDGIERTFAYKLTEDALRVKIFYSQDISGVDSQEALNAWFDECSIVLDATEPTEEQIIDEVNTSNDHWQDSFLYDTVWNARIEDVRKLKTMLANEIGLDVEDPVFNDFVRVRCEVEKQTYFVAEDVENAWQRAHDE